MKWLEHRLQVLDRLLQDVESFHSFGEGQIEGTAESIQKRHQLREAMKEIAEEIAMRKGVTACVVAHEGLVVAHAGQSEGDVLAAASQVCIMTAEKTSDRLKLGTSRQMVIVGADSKFAIVFVRGISIAILSPSTTGLSKALRT